MSLRLTLTQQVILHNLQKTFSSQEPNSPNLPMESTTIKPASAPTYTLNTGLLTRCRPCIDKHEQELTPYYGMPSPILVLRTGLCRVSHTSTVASARATARRGVTGLQIRGEIKSRGELFPCIGSYQWAMLMIASGSALANLTLCARKLGIFDQMFFLFRQEYFLSKETNNAVEVSRRLMI